MRQAKDSGKNEKKKPRLPSKVGHRVHLGTMQTASSPNILIVSLNDSEEFQVFICGAREAG